MDEKITVTMTANKLISMVSKEIGQDVTEVNIEHNNTNILTVIKKDKSLFLKQEGQSDEATIHGKEFYGTNTDTDKLKY